MPTHNTEPRESFPALAKRLLESAYPEQDDVWIAHQVDESLREVDRAVGRRGSRLASLLRSSRKIGPSQEPPPSPTLVPGTASDPLVIGDVPQEPTGFEQRDGLMDELRGMLADRRWAGVCALTGTGGVGKTQLAAAYARWCIGKGSLVVMWINADAPQAITARFAELADRLYARQPGDSVDTAARRAWACLERMPGPALMVFDNARDPGTITRWLPRRGQVYAIVTSTEREFDHLGYAVPVDVFSEAEAVRFLRRHTGWRDDDAARALAAELGFLPLTLAQAARQVAIYGYRDYLGRLHETAASPGWDQKYPREVDRAIRLAVAAMEQNGFGDPTRRLIETIAVLDPSGVKRAILVTGLQALGHLDAAGTIDTVIRRLVDSSIAVLNGAEDVVTMHRLTQRVVVDRALHERTLTATLAFVVSVLEANLIPDLEVRGFAQRADGTHLNDQIEALWTVLTSLPDRADIADVRERVLRMRTWGCRQLLAAVDLRGAIERGLATVGDCTRILGLEHPVTLSAKYQLAYAYRTAGRFYRAIHLFERVAADRSRTLGADDPDTLTVEHSLAYAYQIAGRVGEATKLFERVLAARTRILGADDPDTLKSRHNLASAYRAGDHVDKAITLYEAVLADRERVLGVEHPLTLTTRHSLGLAYQASGRVERAVELLEQVLADRERLPLLGRDHPDTLRSRQTLASAYLAARRITDAVKLYEEVLDEDLLLLGPDHPSTLTTRSNLARAYQSEGRADDAVELSEAVVADYVRVLGADQQPTLVARNDLAEMYRAVGRLADAVDVWQALLADCRRTLGESHSLTRGVAQSMRAMA